MRAVLLVAALVSMPAHAAQPLVAIDVGHYSTEPGATSARGRTELEFNRDLALAIRDALLAARLRVALIGAAGDMHALAQRTTAAHGADLFISVHHDSVQPQYLENWVYESETRAFSDRFAGYSLFVSRRNRRLDASLACASSIGAAMRDKGFAPSRYHAEPIAGEDRPYADEANGVHYYDELYVLHAATQPAVLLEAGVIVNRAEELALRGRMTQQRIAAAVASGAAECLTQRR